MKRIITLCLLPLIFCGCSTVESSVNYTKGTRALEAGDYDTAIMHLEKAVQLDPDLSRNHNNLAAAYLARSRIREAWPHVRKAVILQPRNTAAQGNFRRCFKSLIDMGLVKEGYSQATIVQNLGQPDSTLKRGDEVLWQYGMVALYFRDGRVTGFRDMELRRGRTMRYSEPRHHVAVAIGPPRGRSIPRVRDWVIGRHQEHYAMDTIHGQQTYFET
jgi:tetratricopeptide (TPR) repeat protein